jgi:hypothetical protein
MQKELEIRKKVHLSACALKVEKLQNKIGAAETLLQIATNCSSLCGNEEHFSPPAGP